MFVKYNISLKTLLQQGMSEPVFYGDLVYKFKRIFGKPNLSDQLKTIKRYNKSGIRDSLSPVTVDSYGFLFNCTTVGQASDLITVLTLSFNRLVGA